MKKALIASIIVVLLLFVAAGCTRNNTPGNTVAPETILPSVTDDLVPGVDDEPLGTVSPAITDTPGDAMNSPGGVTESPGLESPGVTVSPTTTTSPAAG